MGLIRTGVKLDAGALDELRAAARNVRATPAIVVTQRHLGPFGRTESQLAEARLRTQLDAACVVAGFPTPAHDADGDVIHYGLDFETGEVLLWDGAGVAGVVRKDAS